jgi:hypothetical protein
MPKPGTNLNGTVSKRGRNSESRVWQNQAWEIEICSWTTMMGFYWKRIFHPRIATRVDPQAVQRRVLSRCGKSITTRSEPISERVNNVRVRRFPRVAAVPIAAVPPANAISENRVADAKDGRPYPHAENPTR